MIIVPTTVSQVGLVCGYTTLYAAHTAARIPLRDWTPDHVRHVIREGSKGTAGMVVFDELLQEADSLAMDVRDQYLHDALAGSTLEDVRRVLNRLCGLACLTVGGHHTLLAKEDDRHYWLDSLGPGLRIFDDPDELAQQLYLSVRSRPWTLRGVKRAKTSKKSLDL